MSWIAPFGMIRHFGLPTMIACFKEVVRIPLPRVSLMVASFWELLFTPQREAEYWDRIVKQFTGLLHNSTMAPFRATKKALMS
jgi:hypothetical protein